MKKILFVVLAFISVNILFAQSAKILGTYLPVVNTEIKQVWIHSGVNNGLPPSSVQVPEYGAGVFWDYSPLPLSIESGSNKNTHTLRTLPITASSPNNNYPEATIASHWTSPISTFDTVWTYSRVDSTGMYTEGVVNFSTGFPVNIDYNNFDSTSGSELIIPSVVEMGLLIKDSILRTTSLPITPPGIPNVPPSSYPLTVNQYSYKTMEVVGWGSLKTPIDSLGDVILAREMDHEVTHYLNNDTVIQAATYERVYYKHFFLRNNTFATSLLMQLNTDTALTQVQYAWYTLPSKTGLINGTVLNSIDNNPITAGEVLLFREGGNFTKNDVLATAEIDPTGIYEFKEIPYGQYRLLARPDLAIYPNAFSSYYEESPDFQDSLKGTSWNACDTLITIGDTSNVTIHVRSNNFSSSPIASQLQGTLKGFSLNKIGGDDPIPGIDIIIKKNPGSKPIISTQTDESGVFTFDNLPNGAYKIWVDMPGLDLPLNATYEFVVEDGRLNKCDFDFTADLDTVTKQPENLNCLESELSIEDNEYLNNIISISPNPYQDVAKIVLDLDVKNNVSILVYDLTGKLMMNVVQNKIINGNTSFEITNLTESGIYFVKIYIGNRVVTKKLIKH